MRHGEGQDILRFSTAGSVDDGKSTLIGQLLLGSKSIYQDQLDSVAEQSRRRGDPYMDLALFTDGLKAEREQRITIDVAYRYFSTPKRKFIIGDCPGHIEYTRNMVTGASTAELAVVLVDATKGLLTQSKRHAFISTLLCIPHLIVAVNKMDLVRYSEDVFFKIKMDFSEFASRLETKSVTFIPVSALHGDNVVERSANMPWYNGTTLLHCLETVNVGANKNLVDFRLPVQCIIRPHQNFRGIAGRISSGRVRVGDEVVSLPSGSSSMVTKLSIGGVEHNECLVGDSVVVELVDDIDVSRGDILVRRNNLPQRTCGLDATICWLANSPLEPRQSYILRSGTREIQAHIERIDYLINVDTLHREESTPFKLNDIGRAQIYLDEPVFYDTYRRNRELGSFILIDPGTHSTVAAGMIRGQTPDLSALVRSDGNDKNLVQVDRLVSRSEREQHRGHKGGVIWLTGLSGSGKSTIGKHLERKLFDSGREVILLDGDSVRTGLCSDLGFSQEDRKENIRRVGELAALLANHGAIVICAFISPFRRGRAVAKQLAAERFLEVYVRCSLEVCERRDPKGLYAKARAGEIRQFTGIDSPYEEPLEPGSVIDTEKQSLEKCVDSLLERAKRLFGI